MTAAHILRTSRGTERKAEMPSGWRRRCLAGLVFAGLAAGATQAAAEGNVHSLSLEMSPGIFGTVRVLSTNGQTYSILAENNITVGYNLSASMQWGEIRGWGIYWGECSGINDCGPGFSTPLLDSSAESHDTFSIDESREIYFPSSVIGVTQNVPIAGTDDSAAMIQLCNDWLADGNDITAGTTLLYTAKATVGLDIVVDVDIPGPPQASVGQPYSYPPAFTPEDIDHTKTVTFQMPVTCAAWHEPPSAGAPSDVDTALPDPEMESVQMALDFSVPSDGAPHEYAGSCPVNVNLNMLVNTNVATPIWVWVKHVDDDGNNWTSDQAEFQTNQITNAGTWMWTRQEPLIVPVDTAVPPPAPAIPLGGIDEVAVGGGGGGGGGETGGAAATAPSGVATGFTGDPNRHVGQVELFAGIGRQVVELPDADGPGSSQVVTFQQVMSSGLKTYDVTCIPEVGPIAADSPDTLVGAGNPVGPDAASPVDQPKPGSGDLATEPRTQASLDVPPIISLVLQDASVDPQHGYVNVPLGQDGFWSDGYSGTVTWRLLVGAVLNPALQGVGTQWTTIAANVGPWGGGATALSPQILSLAEPPVHKVVSAPFVDEFMTEGDDTPQAICNTLRQNLLDQGQSLSGILGNHHIVDVTDDIQPRAQLNAALAYDQNEDPYGEVAVAVLPLRIRCLGNPEIAERFLPSNDAPGGIATPEDFTLISAGLSIGIDGEQPAEPATYAGSCPVDGQVDIKLAANLQGTAQYQVLHLSENNVLTASELTATAVDEFNNGGYWEFDASQTLNLPLEDATLPGFSTEPGGFVTGDFSVPAAGDLVGNNDNDPNVHTGFFRVLASPVGMPQPTADSLWKKYRIECDPGEGTVGDLAGQTGGPVDGDSDAVLDLTMSGPAECAAGSECPLQVKALNGGGTTIPGPLSIRIEPDLDGAGLGASNWSCGGDGADMSCQSDAVDLAPDETADLDVAVIVPGDAEPGSQFRTCAVAAPPVAEADPVRYTQFMLTRLGFDPKGIDGRSGPNTLRAVRDFQRDQGLAESGEIDDVLLQALADSGETFESDEACATVAIVEGEEPEIVAPEPVEPDRPVIVDPTPQVSVCRGGAIRAGQCVCRPGWTRTRVSRFEYVCNRPLVRIVCDNGTVRGRQCVCRPGWRLNRIAPNRFACVRPILRVTCSGGRVVRNQCVCPNGTVRQVRGPNRFACVRVRPRPVACTGGVVRAGKCYCPRGLRLIRGVCVRPAG